MRVTCAAATERFSTLYRVDAIEGGGRLAGEADRGLGFSTLYRVDAIEGPAPDDNRPTDELVSVPSIGSMLLKAVCVL